MAKSRKSNKQSSSKRPVRVQDLQPNKNPKGGKVSFSEITIKKPVDKSSP
jgi:type VI protein secretion system component Hcp